MDEEIYINPATPPASQSITATISITSTEFITVGGGASPTSTASLSRSTHPPYYILNEDYGYIPQKVIDWMASDPNYAALYPGLASCLPGGPSISPEDGCISAAPAVAIAVPDLTTGSAVTVKGVGCFHPGNCPAATSSVGTPAFTPSVAQAANISPATMPSPQLKSTVGSLQSEKTESPKASNIVPNSISIIAPVFGASAPTQQNSESPSLNGAAPNTKTVQPAQGTHSHETPVANQSPQETNRPGIPAVEPTSTPDGGATVIVGASSTVSADSSSNFIVGGQTIASSGSPAVVSKFTLSLAPSASAIVVNGEASTLKATPSSSSSSGLGALIGGAFNGPPAIAEGSQVISANSASDFVLGSQTLAPGASPIVVSGSTYSLAPSTSAIVVNGVTSVLQEPAIMVNPAPVITVGSQPITANSMSQFIVESQTLAPGASPIIVSGSTYSLAPSASAIVINGKTSTLEAGSARTQAAPVIIIASQRVTQNSASQYIVGSQTLAPGNDPITVSGTTYSLAPSASAIIVNGITSILPAYNPANGAPVITIGSQPFTAGLASTSAYAIGSETLIPGGSAITVSGVEVSLAPSGSVIIVSSRTEIFPGGNAPVITVGSQVVTASAESEYVIGSQTLIPGASAITVSGVEVSLGPSASDVAVGGTTETFSAATGSANGTRYGGQTFTGKAYRFEMGLKGQIPCLVLGLLGLAVL